MERSCTTLFAFLASWGMLRGPSDLLQKSPSALIPLLEAINGRKEWWEIDVNRYGNKTIANQLIDCFSTISETLRGILEQKQTVTLITKIMLGVFSNVPAFDKYFTDGMKLSGFIANHFNSQNYTENTFERAMDDIRKLYETHEEAIHTRKIPLLNFDGSESSRTYNYAKIIDMYGFQKGLEKAKQKDK